MSCCVWSAWLGHQPDRSEQAAIIIRHDLHNVSMQFRCFVGESAYPKNQISAVHLDALDGTRLPPLHGRGGWSSSRWRRRNGDWTRQCDRRRGPSSEGVRGRRGHGHAHRR